MPQGRLIKRTVTEEIYDDRTCPVSDIDDDEGDAIDDDMDDDAGEGAHEPPRAARGKHPDSLSVSGTETAGADQSDLEGEEE